MISKEPLKILLVHLYANGDCLYATTVAKQIKMDYPNAKLTWAIADFCSAIIKNNPYVDEILSLKNITKDHLGKFKKLKKDFLIQKEKGIWDEVFVTHNLDNQALYDGTIRGMVLNAYPHPITVPIQPVLHLSGEEIQAAENFAIANNLIAFKNVILWEFAPQSGQSVINLDKVLELSRRISLIPSTCVILTSGKKIPAIENVFDASVLSIRENAALTHFCTLLIGSSSGITWLTTSDAAKPLPMIQLFDQDVAFLNAPSVDFKRFGIDNIKLIEITEVSDDLIHNCVKEVLETNFESAKLDYNQNIKLTFTTTRSIVYNLLCYVEIREVIKHFRVMTRLHGHNKRFLSTFFKAILGFPFRLIGNVVKKNI